MLVGTAMVNCFLDSRVDPEFCNEGLSKEECILKLLDFMNFLEAMGAFLLNT